MEVVKRQYLAPVVTGIALVFAFSRMGDHSFLSAASSVSAFTVLAVLAAMVSGHLLASLRLKLIAGDLSTNLSFRDSVAALAYGQLAGSFFFQVIGQTIARSAVLSPSGVSLPTVIVMTGYERIVAAGVSFVLAIAGALFLFGRIVTDFAAGGAALAKILVGIAVVTCAGAYMAWGGHAQRLVSSANSWEIIKRVGRAAALSLAI